MRPENKRMQDFLENHQISDVTPKYISTGSLKGCWRLCRRVKVQGKTIFFKWGSTDAEQLNGLGFTDFDGKPLGTYSGNGGSWQVFVRGHQELLNAIRF